MDGCPVISVVTMSEVLLKNIMKQYPGAKNPSVHDVNLHIEDKEFIVLVGPSGCGKSTTLRMVAGLEDISGGELYIDGRLCNDVAPKDRDIAMVFQNYALYPHMSVYDNMAFGLKLKKTPKDEIDKKVREAAEILDITQYLERKPKALSGGQRQRVAIARAIALEPEIIVMDEATSALDVSVQKTVIELITKLQREKNICIGFICHDLGLIQSFAHQVAVMYLGNIVEVMPGESIGEGCKHPYSQALLDSVFDTKMDFSKKIEAIKGEPPSPLDVPPGCAFQDRCPHCMEICRKERPALMEVGQDHQAACHLYAKGNQ